MHRRLICISLNWLNVLSLNEYVQRCHLELFDSCQFNDVSAGRVSLIGSSDSICMYTSGQVHGEAWAGRPVLTTPSWPPLLLVACFCAPPPEHDASTQSHVFLVPSEEASALSWYSA